MITGLPGVGKTTAILDLLARTAGERWATIPVSGGCVCCAGAPSFQVALHRLLAEAKPTRLLIEAAGHPRGLLEMLRSSYADRLDVRATIGLVAPDHAINPKMLANPVFREQWDLADVLILNKLDEAGPGALEKFQMWANELRPPKLLIAATRRGHLDPAWLDLARDGAISNDRIEV